MLPNEKKLRPMRIDEGNWVYEPGILQRSDGIVITTAVVIGIPVKLSGFRDHKEI
jgi:hypothetical protein